MRGYIFNRLASLIPVLFVVSIVVFFIIHITPGNPAAIMLGNEATPEQIEALQEELGLHLPLSQQYVQWVLGVLKGDLGNSYFMKKPVTEAIFEHLRPTLSLAILSQVIAIILAIPIGIIAAVRRGTFIDQSLMGLSLIGLAVPNFIFGLLLILLFGVTLNWLPVAGFQPISEGLWEHIKYLILPAISLGAMQTALIARMTRATMLEVLHANYVKTARSKGVREKNVIYKHTLRNALIPIVTVIGQTFATLVAGAVITETIFNIPGLGQLIINSIERRDYAVIQGVVLFVTISFVFINLFIDLLYGIIDPRVRLGTKIGGG